MIRILIPLLLLAACSGKPEIPENVLSLEKMEAITWDLIRADGVLSHTVRSDSTVNELEKRSGLYQQVLQVHGISKEDYKRSLRFYESRPDLFREVFNSMQKKANKAPELRKGPVRKDTTI